DLLDQVPAEPACFAHGDYKADHLLVGRAGVTLIDFDRCARSEPALDLAKFLADVRWWTERRPGAVASAQAEFLAGYGPTSWLRPIICCTLLSARYEPGARCVTTYALEAGNGDGTRARTIGVVELTPAGRSHRRFDEDPLLPGLAAATDAAVVASRLGSCCAA